MDELITEDDRATRRVTLELYRNTNFDDAKILRQALSPRNIPTLVIFGRNDPFISWRYAERQRETFAECRDSGLGRLRPLPHVQHPERTAEKVTAFLTTVVGAAG